jgi:hypothetical protein
MAQSDTVSVNGAAWGEVTNADVTSVITLQNTGGAPCWLVRGSSAPDDGPEAGSLLLLPGAALIGEAVADLWPGLTGARVYAYAPDGTSVAVSHD